MQFEDGALPAGPPAANAGAAAAGAAGSAGQCSLVRCSDHEFLVDGLFLFSSLFDGMIPTSPNFFFEG